ncbi:zinc-dependent alcohol dehydrogenase [Dasania marina]|uniref:zinc-dependent alcohol dehydrogenase n=1 Tax=Dasania marina TaxID=471499 RepID=UPI0003688E38|nr:zinc-binding dehydrogenase [Dasania marina]
MKTLAAKLVAAHRFEVTEVELPALNSDQVLIDVSSCGICSSEVPIFDGSTVGTPGVSFRYKEYPADLGHEVVGTIIDKGKHVQNFALGDVVTGLTYSGCGFAQHFIENQDMLVKVPDNYLTRSQFAVGEPLMATINIINQCQPQYGDSVLVVGDGFMSQLLIAALAKLPLAQLIVVGHHENRLAMAKRFGATAVINNKTSDAWQQVMTLTQDLGADIAIDYAGTSSALGLAASLCKAKVRAKLVLAAAYDNNMPITIGNYLQNRAPVLIPAYPNQSQNKQLDLERAMWALSQDIFPMEELITHQYSLSAVGQGYQESIARSGDFIKGIVLPQQV